MRRAGLIVALAAGCFHPSAPAGLPCVDDVCPSGQFCDNGFCVVTPGDPDAGVDGPVDGPGDGVSQLDSDGDGIDDADDNCPMKANTNQHDEDADLRGDVCDGCPHIMQATFDDDDGDGVDDPCDPDPGTPGDFIDRFIPFDTLPTDLTLANAANWSVSNDQAHQTSLAVAMERMLIPDIRSYVTAEVAGTIDDLGATTTRELKIVAGRVADSDWFSCCFDDTDGSSTFTLEIEQEASNSVRAETARPDRLNQGFVLRISAETATQQITCTGTEGGVTRNVNAQPAAPIALQDGRVEILSNRIAFSIDYIILFGRN